MFLNEEEKENKRDKGNVCGGEKEEEKKRKKKEKEKRNREKASVRE